MLSSLSDIFTQTVESGDDPFSKVTPNVVLLSRSASGDERESVESIRKRAPFQYAAQNRMVTSLDYDALILRKYSNFIQDIICWGGDDDRRRDFGSVYASIVWKENLSSTTIGEIRNEIRSLVRNLSTISFQIKFVAPSETWISTETYYQYSPSLSALTESSVNQLVKNVVVEYFSNNVGNFQQNFRRSNLLTLIDESDPAVLSSRASIKMQQRIQPVLTLRENHTLKFPVAIKTATDTTTPVVKSSLFRYNNQTVFIRNKLTDRVKVSAEGQVPVVFDVLPSSKLEVVNTDGNVVVSNIGNYDPENGIVYVTGLTVESVLSSNNYIKMFATPANESVIDADFSTVLHYDPEESVVKPVTVTSRV